MIPEIDISPLFQEDDGRWARVDRQVCDAACEIGFMTVKGFPSAGLIAPGIHNSILRLFSLSPDAQRKLWKNNFASENPNLYRGWFPLESGEARSREGFEIGPDLVRELPDDGSQDLLCEPSVFPPEAMLPGWRETTAAYYTAVERVGFVLLAAIARGFGIPENIFEDAFKDGISTLRLLRYPSWDARDPDATRVENYFIDWKGERVEVVCGGHVDSGLITILAQCDASGLQAKSADGEWQDVPPAEGAFVVNFGGLLSRWTGGRVRATEHRVLSSGEERFSIPFFFEPGANTVISPLPIEGIEPFEPFQFGDHLWATTTKFAENYGLGHLRPLRAPYRDPFSKT
jgi:isopenicillin N synthase-like dioxygenase